MHWAGVFEGKRKLLGHRICTPPKIRRVEHEIIRPLLQTSSTDTLYYILLELYVLQMIRHVSDKVFISVSIYLFKKKDTQLA